MWSQCIKSASTYWVQILSRTWAIVLLHWRLGHNISSSVTLKAPQTSFAEVDHLCMRYDYQLSSQQHAENIISGVTINYKCAAVSSALSGWRNGDHNCSTLAPPVRSHGVYYLERINSTYLGRPWGAYSRVIFANTFMSSAILPEGWNDWVDSTRRRLRLSCCTLLLSFKPCQYSWTKRWSHSWQRAW